MVNISTVDVVEGNEKIILGLMWSLILWYDVQGHRGQRLGQAPSSGSARDELLAWLKRMLPEREIKNFTSDWRDGTLLADLINILQPNVLPGALPVDPLALATLCISSASKFSQHSTYLPTFLPTIYRQLQNLSSLFRPSCRLRT